MPYSIKYFSDLYQYNTSILPIGETLVNKFGHSPKLVLCREVGPEPELLRNNNRIGSDKLNQTVCKYAFIDFRETGKKRNRS